MTSTFKYILAAHGLETVKPKIYRPGKELEPKGSDFTSAQVFEDVESLGTSLLGTPVFSNLEIETVQYEFEGEQREVRGFEAERAMSAVLFTIDQTKNIITTAVQGRNGTIKQYISDGDFDVKIQGVLYGQGKLYPKDDVQNLIAICKAPAALKVNSWFLQMFGIYELVVESYNFPQMAGKTNVQPFELNCLSETPFELLLKEEKV